MARSEQYCESRAAGPPALTTLDTLAFRMQGSMCNSCMFAPTALCIGRSLSEQCPVLQEHQAQQHHALQPLPHARLLHPPLTCALQSLCMNKSFQSWTLPALQARQVQEQLSAQASELANKVAGHAAEICGLKLEQVGRAAVGNRACA